MEIRRRVAVIGTALLLGNAAATIACGPKVVLTTPEGHRAYAADQIAVRVTEFERFAINANKENKLSDNDTGIILAFAIEAQKVLAKAPDGWQAQVKELWRAAKPKVAGLADPTLASTADIFDALIGGL